jgi:hypothetical protein
MPMETDMPAEIAAMRAEVRAGLEALRAEMRVGFAEVRAILEPLTGGTPPSPVNRPRLWRWLSSRDWDGEQW